MKYLLSCLFFVPVFLLAQDFQWASKVIAFSSEFDYKKYPGQYRANQVLGEPSTFSLNKANPCAWAPSKKNNEESDFIEVGFAIPQKVQQVVVHESFNPGSISRIIVKGEKGVEQTVYEVDSLIALSSARLLSVKFAPTTFKVNAVRIEMQTKYIDGFNQIDAIAIANHHEPYEIKINVNPEVEKQVVTMKSLGGAVNSSTADLSPVIAPNGKTLYFTRQNHPENIAPIEAQDVWMSQVREDGTFEPAQNVKAPVNNSFNNSVFGITPDGQKIFLLNQYNKDGTSTPGISFTQKQIDGWAFPENIEIDSFQNHGPFGEYCISNSGKILVMAIMLDKQGTKDLHVSFRKEDGTWTEPKSLGNRLNTAASEISPFLASDEKTLYYSTSGFPTYGGSDIFVTRRLDDTWENWTQPENLGPYLNSKEFDAYYTLPAKGDYVYLVSYREGGLGESDIYRASVPKVLRPEAVALVRGTVRNQKTNEPLAASIAYYALSSGKEIGLAQSDPVTGKYEIVLPAGEKYGFSAKREQFLPVSSEFELPKTAGYQEKEVDLYLVPIEKGAKIVINNVYFDTDKYELRKESFVELDQLVAIMKKYSSMQIEISGHTDDVGEAAYNLTLSKNRAASVMRYLTGKGIQEQRIKAQGYGEETPLVPNTDADSRQTNRRVEFTVQSL